MSRLWTTRLRELCLPSKMLHQTCDGRKYKIENPLCLPSKMLHQT